MLKTLTLLALCCCLGLAMPVSAAAPLHGTPAGDYSDRAFLTGMIVHHEAAVTMAEDALLAARDARVRRWAQEVIKTQQAEIDEMRRWLKEKGGEDPQAAAAMSHSMHAMMAGDTSHDPDYNFVSMMLEHHAGAIPMSLDALMRSDDHRIVGLAQQIIDTQSKEIAAYRAWLWDREHIPAHRG